MRVLRLLLLISIGLWHLAAVGAEYRLNNNDIIRGEAVSFNDDGLVVRLEIGGYSPRISWSKLTQETLKELAKNPEAAVFVEPFIDEPPVPKEKQVKKEIVLKPVPRVDRVEKAGLLAFLVTPAGLAIALVLLLANLYAAYEIARFRNRPPGLVCGLALIFPVLAPALFLALPTAPESEADLAGSEPVPETSTVGKATTGSLAKTPMASGLSLAHGEKAVAATLGPQIYKRGEFTFNRRFMETKFANFFRMVQGEEFVLVVRAGRDEYVAKRISRITSNDMHLQLIRGGEVSVAFADVNEVQVRPNDGKA
jgi:hypothetical protein